MGLRCRFAECAVSDGSNVSLSAALGRFAEALMHFASNADEESKTKVTMSSFEADMNTAFDIMFTSWLQSKEAKVRLTVAESLGFMSACLDRPKYEFHIPKLIPAYLLLYKNEKPSDHLPISSGLCNVLLVGVRDDSKFLEALIQIVMAGKKRRMQTFACSPFCLLVALQAFTQ
jgi:hypothetical protein